MSSREFEQLQREHETLLTALDTEPPEQVANLASAFIDRVRRRAENIGNPTERNQLRANLRFWATVVQETTGSYPNTHLPAPAGVALSQERSRRTTARKPPSRPTLWQAVSYASSAALLALVALITGSLMTGVVIPQSQITVPPPITTTPGPNFTATALAATVNSLAATLTAIPPTRTPAPDTATFTATPAPSDTASSTPSATATPSFTPTPTFQRVTATFTPSPTFSIQLTLPITFGTPGFFPTAFIFDTPETIE